MANGAAPELRIQTLYQDRFVAAVRSGHDLLADGAITPERYVACGHVVVSRRGASEGPVDRALGAVGLARRVVAVTADFRSAIEIASRSDLVAQVPRSWLDALEGDAARRIQSLSIPVATPEIVVSLTWHPRMEADPAHRWLRELVREVCRSGRPPQ